MQLLSVLCDLTRLGNARIDATLENLAKMVMEPTETVKLKIENLVSEGFLDNLTIDENGRLRCLLKRVL